MKELLQKNVTKKTLIGGTIITAFILCGFLAAFIVHEASAYKINAAGWGLLAILVAVFLIEWAFILFMFDKNSSEDGESLNMSPLKWCICFAPAAALLILVAVLYSVLNDVAFFDVTANNFGLGLVVILFVVGALTLAAIGVKKLTGVWKKERDKEVVMKIVGKDDPEAADALGAFSVDGGSNSSLAPRSEFVFPDLLKIDEEYAEKPYEAVKSDEVSLSDITEGFNRYLEKNGMYYPIDILRSFISGMACSHIIILEGLSGIGKTSLPRFFAQYTGCNVNFTPVQSSWRDRTDILGYYNDFVGAFKETPFLRAIYRANYENSDINLLVLDEMNLSKVEYYFADFISVLELDKEQWKIELMPVSTAGKMPEKLDNCALVVPENVWFIGTANKDDSTQTVTDKVYDRAIVIEFKRRRTPTPFLGDVKPISLGSDRLLSLFKEAAANPDYAFSKEDYDKFNRLSDFMAQTFDVNFGNRILNQIESFVPTFVACGGKASKAVDLMFCRKVLRKLDGRFEEDLRENLDKLEKFVINLYGKEDFSDTIEQIGKLKRKIY